MSGAATVLATAAVLALLYGVKNRTVGYNTFTAIFVVFFFLYGLIVPLDDLLHLPSLSGGFPSPHANGWFLLHFALALAGLAVGLGVVMALVPRARCAAAPPVEHAPSRALFISALCLAALAAGFELINFVRVGGLSSVLLGKVEYQTRVDALPFTMPSYIVGNVAVAAMALHSAMEWTGARRAVILRLAAFLALISPPLLLALLLTRRAELIGWVLIAFVGATWARPLRHLTLRLVVLALAAYAMSPLLLAVRNAPNPLHHSWWVWFAEGLNPGVGEFSTPYGVFNEYTARMAGAPLRWGRTYVDGLAATVPNRIWPGEKPRQIDAEVRDRLFPAYGSGLASPGFSAMLEAFINFGTWGIPPVFAVFGLVLGLLETLRTRIRPAIAPVAYLSLLPLAQTFHRSAFGPSVLSVGAMTAFALGLFLATYLPAARKRA